MSDEPKSRRGPARRDPRCYQIMQDIVIPAGTIMRRAADQRGGADAVECAVGFSRDFAGNLVVQIHPDAVASGFFKPVIA